jgi:hypothetical protein
VEEVACLLYYLLHADCTPVSVQMEAKGLAIFDGFAMTVLLPRLPLKAWQELHVHVPLKYHVGFYHLIWRSEANFPSFFRPHPAKIACIVGLFARISLTQGPILSSYRGSGGLVE